MELRWADIEDFPGWGVSENGHLVNDRTTRFITPRTNKQGILMAGLMRGGKQYTRSVALIVARAFVENPVPQHFDSVIHLNGDRTDCRALNLMWRSRPFALQYHAMFNDDPYRVAVRIEDTNEYYSSLRELCTTYGLVEISAYHQMRNGECSFPYNWRILEVRTD